MELRLGARLQDGCSPKHQLYVPNAWCWLCRCESSGLAVLSCIVFKIDVFIEMAESERGRVKASPQTTTTTKGHSWSRPEIGA